MILKSISIAQAFLLSFRVMYPLSHIILILGYMWKPQTQNVYKWTLHLLYTSVFSHISRWHYNLLAANS